MRLLFATVALCALLAPSAASPQDELAKLARPWKRGLSWITGQAEPQARSRRGQGAAAVICSTCKNSGAP